MQEKTQGAVGCMMNEWVAGLTRRIKGCILHFDPAWPIESMGVFCCVAV